MVKPTQHTDLLRDATAEQLELAAAYNHTELFCLNALSVGGEANRAPDITWTFAGDTMESMIAFPHLSAEIASEKLDEIILFYIGRRPQGVGCWSLYPPQPRDLGVRLLARGFQPGWQPSWLALHLQDLQLNHPSPKELQVVPDNFSHLEKIKNLPYGDTDLRIFSHQPEEAPASLQRFIAFLDKQIVAHCSVLSTTGTLGAAGIYHVGVVPQFRNRGIGKAVVAAACLHALNHGYHYALLNGTGARMYEQLGFKKLGSGRTWWLKTSRLLSHPPTKNEIILAEAIGRGDTGALAVLGFGIAALQARITNGMTLMQLAVHCRQPVSAEWLLSHGVALAALEAWDLGWKERAAAILAEHPRQVNQLYGENDITLLHVAAERDDQELAKLALTAQPDMGTRDKSYDSTALEWARHLQRTGIMRLIEEYEKGLG